MPANDHELSLHGLSIFSCFENLQCQVDLFEHTRAGAPRILSHWRQPSRCVPAVDADQRVAHSLVDARLAQSAARKALNLVVVGSSPTVGDA